MGKIAREYKDCLDYIEGYWNKIIIKNTQKNSNAHFIPLPKPYLTPNNKKFKYIFYLSNLQLSQIDNFLVYVENKTKELDPTCEKGLVSSRFSSIEALQKAANHATFEEARLSAERLASAYVANPSPIQRTVIETEAQRWGIRAHGTNINLIGIDVNKATAIQFIKDNASSFFPNSTSIKSILPIFFGNGENDIEILKKIQSMVGIGVIVAHPEGGYFLPEEMIPNQTIKTKGAYGHGMLEAIPEVLNRLNQTFKTNLI